jgi:hypothetical protein
VTGISPAVMVSVVIVAACADAPSRTAAANVRRGIRHFMIEASPVNRCRLVSGGRETRPVRDLAV